MAIRIEQPGLAELSLRTAAEVGKARKEERAEELRLKQEATKRAQAWELEKMEITSRLDFEKEVRAKSWELEKAEMASRLDFEREERKRQRELDRIDTALEQIDKEVESGRITEEQAGPLRFTYEMKKYGLTTPISLVTPEEERFGVAPWYLSPEHRETPEGRAALRRAMVERAGIRRTDVDAAIKFLQEYEEKKPRGKWWPLLAEERTPEEDKAAEYYRGVLAEVGIEEPGLVEPILPEEVTPEGRIPTTYSIGEIVERGGRRYKVVGYDTDGEPLVEPL